MFRTAAFSFIILFFPVLLMAQSIQWASTLEHQFNNFGKKDYSGLKVLGPPDATPGTLSPKAFRLSAESETGSIIVGYEHPQEIKKIIVVENHHPGCITEIAVHDLNFEKFIVYQSPQIEITDKSRVLIIPVPDFPHKVAKVELTINTFSRPGWAQIDAIGISNEIEQYHINQELQQFRSSDIHLELPFASKKEKLGPRINTEYHETKPVISPDGKTLFFARQNYPENFRGRKDDQDIYVATIAGNTFSPAKNIGEPLNDESSNGVVSVTPDGNTLLLMNRYGKKGPESEGVSISHRTKNGWSYPAPLEIQDFYNLNFYADYYLANNGRVLLMAIERKDGFGDQDLYVSFYAGGNKWTKPKNLGPIINTTQAEFSCFLASDMKTLFFSSTGHGGYGGSDIFYSKRLDETWTSWSKPKNIGPAVNSAAWDAYYTVTADGTNAYFVSQEGGTSGSKDIFRISLPQEFKPEPVMMVSGKVYNVKTKEPINAQVIIESLPEGDEKGIARTNPEDGSYKIVLQRGFNYGFYAQAKNFMAVNEHVDLTHFDEYTEINVDLYLAPIEVGQVIKVNNIFFERGTPNLLPESFPQLRRLVDFLQENPTVKIELGGHTDNQGLMKTNLELSQQRVDKIKEFLVESGIHSERLTTRAYGGTRPVASNASEETRQLNRRVEITILAF